MPNNCSVGDDSLDVQKQGNGDEGNEKNIGSSSREGCIDEDDPPVLKILISETDGSNKVSDVKSMDDAKVLEKGEKADVVVHKMCGLGRSESVHEQCRVCQQQTEEVLVELGCHCRGELAKVHRSCINMWFSRRGSNKCEICQQVAVNVQCPEPLPHTNYWIWRVDPAYQRFNLTQQRERSCYSPLWIAFSILIAGLLLDVLVSISLGVSALPVNIIIGVLIVLGLGTAFRLALECCHEWRFRRIPQRAELNVNPGIQQVV